MSGACHQCGCPAVSPAHALAAAVARDDMAVALDLGLLRAEPCPACSDGCRARIVAARDDRRGALAARERFRARQQRLERRAAARAATRVQPPATPSAVPAPALPPSAADALARALARAGRGGGA